jgi:hypothetical protein
LLALRLQERKLVEALFACYGPDHNTICRLLCCPHAAEEVQDLVAEAQADIRCEVCRNPEVRSPPSLKSFPYQLDTDLIFIYIAGRGVDDPL